MSENTPSLPGGAVPPKPPEASKVQPKKETVRINLPPKPSAAPTIKLPTLPPGGPAAGPGATPFAPPAAAAPKAPIAAAPAVAAAAPKAPTAPRPAAPPPAPTVSGLDKALAVGALVCALAALAGVVVCLMSFKPA